MYTDGAFHKLDWFNTVYGKIDVNENNFQSEVSKGLWKYSGAWDLSEIKSDADVVEYTMFNEEGQIIYNETVPILRDGSRGEPGKDGQNAVSYAIDSPVVYKEGEVVTFTFYRLETGRRIETEYYYKIFGYNGSDWIDIKKGRDTQVTIQPIDPQTSFTYSKVRITIYYDENYLEDLDTEYTELIYDGKNGVSKFYDIGCPVVYKFGDRPEFSFYINEDGNRTAEIVYYKIYVNNDFGKVVYSGRASNFTWPEVIQHYENQDDIDSITCVIYASEDAETPLDIESTERITDGTDSISMHCRNDNVQLACNAFGFLKKTLNQDVTVVCYKGQDMVIPDEIKVFVEPEALASKLRVTVPEVLDLLYENNIHLSMNADTEPVSGHIRIEAKVEDVYLNKEVSVNTTNDGESAFSVHTSNDVITLDSDEDGKLKGELNSIIGIHVYYGDLDICDTKKITVTLNNHTVKGANLNVGQWDSATGNISISQPLGTKTSSGKLCFTVKVNDYYGVSNSYEVVFPISVTQDGATSEFYSIEGSGVYTLDYPAEYSFYKRRGNAAAQVEVYYTAEYSDYGGSAFAEFTAGFGKKITINANSNYQRIRIKIFSDAEHTKLLDNQTYYLATEAPQVIVLNGFQLISTDVDNYTTAASELKISFVGYLNKKRFDVQCLTGLGELILPKGFSVLSNKPSTVSEDGVLTISVDKGIEIQETGSIALTFRMNNVRYSGNFSFAPQHDGINQFSLLLNAEQITIDKEGEVYPDVIYPNIIHTTSRLDKMVDEVTYNKDIDPDDKLKIVAKTIPSLKEVNVTYDKSTKYESDAQYYTRVYPKYIRGYNGTAAVKNKGWTIKQSIDGVEKELLMVFYTPSV